MNSTWGTKRTCPSCSAHFYDLNKPLAQCPKCQHQFDPTQIARGRKRAARKEMPEEKPQVVTGTVLAGKKSPAQKKKDARPMDDDAADALPAMDDMDDMEGIDMLEELSDREDAAANEDDADDESLIDEIDAGEDALVGNVEDEEAEALVEEIEEEEEDARSRSKQKVKKK